MDVRSPLRGNTAAPGCRNRRLPSKGKTVGRDPDECKGNGCGIDNADTDPKLPERVVPRVGTGCTNPPKETIPPYRLIAAPGVGEVRGWELADPNTGGNKNV